MLSTPSLSSPLRASDADANATKRPVWSTELGPAEVKPTGAGRGARRLGAPLRITVLSVFRVAASAPAAPIRASAIKVKVRASLCMPATVGRPPQHPLTRRSKGQFGCPYHLDRAARVAEGCHAGVHKLPQRLAAQLAGLRRGPRRVAVADEHQIEAADQRGQRRGLDAEV